MQYALLIYQEPGIRESLSEAELLAARDEFTLLAGDPRYLDGAQLAPSETARTVRVEDGRTLTTDGPFADTKEVFGGFCVLEADNLDQAIEFAARIPVARLGGSVEVRPLAER
jgi:hypothetical protein